MFANQDLVLSIVLDEYWKRTWEMLGFNRENDSYPSISPRTGRVVSVLPSSVVDRGLVSRSSENKDYKIVI